MTVAVLNKKSGVGKTPFALPLAGAWTAPRSQDPGSFSARLPVDITPALRGRMKIAAFQPAITVADMLRDLFTREIPPTDGETP